MIKRREFIAGLGGAAAWPLAARAQQGSRVRRIGLLQGRDENDPVAKTYVSAFTQALADLGWTVGRNVRMDLRGGGARILKIVPIIAPVHSDAEIETAIVALGREPRGGLVVMPDGFTAVHRAPIILAAALNNVPSVHSISEDARDGGLLSYGPEQVDIWRRTATYVDRILRGAKPAELPVQLAVKYEMVVNLKTAKALGLTVPQSILLTADEVIE